MNKFSIGLLLVIYWSSISIEAMRSVCFFDSAAPQKQARFTADNIDTSLCTHLVYNKANVNQTMNVMEIGDEKIDIIDKGYEKFVSLKLKKPEIKIMIALRGWDIGKRHLHSTEENIKLFVKSAVDFLKAHKFDGIHFELEHFYSIDQQNGITALLIALKNAFQQNTPVFLLTATVSPLEIAIKGYNVTFFKNTLDFITVMAFHFHGTWEDKVDHHAPLYLRSWDKYTLSADFGIRKWIEAGIPPRKIVLGIPIFGTRWALQSNKTGPNAPAKGEEPSLSYYEICHAVKNEGWQVFRDPNQLMGPYAVSPPSPTKNRTWVGYDDPEMAIVKANYILEKKLGGAAVWDVSLDDFLNSCGQGRNPVLTAIVKTLKTLPSSIPSPTPIDDSCECQC